MRSLVYEQADVAYGVLIPVAGTSPYVDNAKASPGDGGIWKQAVDICLPVPRRQERRLFREYVFGYRCGWNGISRGLDEASQVSKVEVSGSL